jgi:hypothetical protein
VGDRQQLWGLLGRLGARPLGSGGGAFLAPRRTFRAFVRGRASQNLYGESVEDLLGTSVADARRATGTDQPAPAAQPGDRVRFAGYVALGALVGSTLLAVACALLPLGLAAAAFAPRRAKTAEA